MDPDFRQEDNGVGEIKTSALNTKLRLPEFISGSMIFATF